MRLLTQDEKEQLHSQSKDFLKLIIELRDKVGSSHDDEDFLELEDDSLDSTVRQICRTILKSADVKTDFGCPLCRS
jgi:hypothetical protein